MMSDEKRLQVITGGTSGMGLATAMALGIYGPVLIGGRNQQRLNDALLKLREAGVEAYGKPCDISNTTSLKEFVDYAVSLYPIGNVVNAAAIDSGSAEMIWKINVQGTIHVVEAFLPYMKNAALVNFSSITGYFYQATQEEIALWSAPNSPDFFAKSFEMAKSKDLDERMKYLGEEFLVYIASKRFVIYYTQANAVRFGKKNCRIFSVAPGSFDTPMLRGNNDEVAIKRIESGTAFRRMGTPAEMAHFVRALLEPGHEYLTGVDLPLDGGKMAMSFAKQLD